MVSRVSYLILYEYYDTHICPFGQNRGAGLVHPLPVFRGSFKPLYSTNQWEKDVYDSNFPYKVVPPSYKLVYKPQ